jgi:outer membrane protein assembly factor BamA
MPLDPGGFLEPPPYVDPRPDPPTVPRSRITARHPYDPLPSLRPRAYSLNFGQGTFGNALQIATTGGDAVGHHAFSASIGVEVERPDPQFSLGYVYGRLPFDLRVSMFRNLNPRAGYRYADQQPVWIEETLGVTSGLSYAVPTAFDSSSFGLSYSVARMGGALPLVRGVDPYARIEVDPPRGYLGTLHLGYAYSNIERYLWSVGPERGFTLAVSTDIAEHALASDYKLYVFSYSATGYVPLPWARHHTLALHGASSITMGDYPRRGLFYTGGFLDVPIADELTNQVFQSGFILRGYAPVAFIGSQYHLANFEYRFPILNVDHGVSTLPAFLQRLNGAVFADYGGAFDTLDPENWRDQLHLGVGGELWVEATFGYFLSLNLRLGYAHGVRDQAAIPGGQTYFVLAAPF